MHLNPGNLFKTTEKGLKTWHGPYTFLIIDEDYAIYITTNNNKGWRKYRLEYLIPNIQAGYVVQIA